MRPWYAALIACEWASKDRGRGLNLSSCIIYVDLVFSEEVEIESRSLLRMDHFYQNTKWKVKSFAKKLVLLF